MNAIEIRTELQRLIEQENDLHILMAIKTLLKKTSLNPILKEKLTSRALKSEQNIIENDLFNREEAEKKIKPHLG